MLESSLAFLGPAIETSAFAANTAMATNKILYVFIVLVFSFLMFDLYITIFYKNFDLYFSAYNRSVF